MLKLLFPLLLLSGLSVATSPGPALAPGDQQDPAGAETEAPDEAREPVRIEPRRALVEGREPLVFELGEPALPLVIPRAEKLEYGVHVAVGPLGATVGSVVIDSGVDAYQESLVLLGAGAGGGGGEGRETGWLRAKAEGSYLWYSMETVLDSRYLPQAWPSISTYYRQSGSENRRRENQLGLLEGRQQTAYRRDTKKGAPIGERIWMAPEYRDIPDGTVDMLGAVYLARTLLLSEAESLVFPLLDKKDLWEMTLSLGERKTVEVPAGSFEAVEILLEPATWPGEKEKEKSKFRGLFGIRGSIHLWVDANTGVPVRISGTIPAGPVSIECDIFLKTFSGTPDAFHPLGEEVPGDEGATVATEPAPEG